MNRRIVLAALCLAAIVQAPSDAAADDVGVTCTKDGYCTTTVDHPVPGNDDGTRGDHSCRWDDRVVPCSQGSATFSSSDGCYVEPASALPASGPVLAEYKAHGGSILWESCPYGGGGGYVWRAAAEAKPQVTAAIVRAQAQRLVPTADVGLAPHGSTLVNIETVMWADAPAEQNLPTVTLLGQQVGIQLHLEHVRWDFGDGSTDPEGPAGKPYDDEGAPCRARLCADYYGHVYTRTGVVEVEAVASWHASFTVDGGAVQQIDDPVPGPPGRAQIQVKQARAVLVPNPGEH